MAVGDITINAGRLQVVDFTFPIWFDHLGILVKVNITFSIKVEGTNTATHTTFYNFQWQIESFRPYLGRLFKVKKGKFWSIFFPLTVLNNDLFQS